MTLLSNNPELIDAVKVAGDEPICRKDTGKGHKLRKWSRGHQFIDRQRWGPHRNVGTTLQVSLLKILPTL